MLGTLNGPTINKAQQILLALHGLKAEVVQEEVALGLQGSIQGRSKAFYCRHKAIREILHSSARLIVDLAIQDFHCCHKGWIRILLVVTDDNPTGENTIIGMSGHEGNGELSGELIQFGRLNSVTNSH